MKTNGCVDLRVVGLGTLVINTVWGEDFSAFLLMNALFLVINALTAEVS